MIANRSAVAVAVLVGATLCGADAAIACGPILKVSFVEASPDRFTAELAPDADARVADITIDLGPSEGRAYVDTYYGPEDREDGGRAATLKSVSGFSDGATRGTLTFDAFQPGQRFSIRVDLDEQVSAGNPNWLDVGEISGTAVSATLIAPDGARVPLSGRMDSDGVVMLGNRGCS